MVMFFVGLVLLVIALAILIFTLTINAGVQATAARLIENGKEIEGAANDVLAIANDVLDAIGNGATPEELAEKIGELRRATAGLN